MSKEINELTQAVVDGALAESKDMLERMKEFADRAAGDMNSELDREAIQQEIDQLSGEIVKIGESSEFHFQNKETNTDVLGSKDLDAPTADRDPEVIKGIEDALKHISEMRSELEELQNRLEQTIKSTETGFININNQKNNGCMGIEETDRLQGLYDMECLNCGEKYKTKGSNIYEKKCPKCQNGKKI